MVRLIGALSVVPLTKAVYVCSVLHGQDWTGGNDGHWGPTVASCGCLTVEEEFVERTTEEDPGRLYGWQYTFRFKKPGDGLAPGRIGRSSQNFTVGPAHSECFTPDCYTADEALRFYDEAHDTYMCLTLPYDRKEGILYEVQWGFAPCSLFVDPVDPRDVRGPNKNYFVRRGESQLVFVSSTFPGRQPTCLETFFAGEEMGVENVFFRDPNNCTELPNATNWNGGQSFFFSETLPTEGECQLAVV